MEKLVSLHKHWINTDAVKQVVTVKIVEDSKLPNEIRQLAEMHSSFARLSVLYGLTYVVIEGYKELNFTNQKVDSLLAKEDFVDALRLFRNATFHYQKQAIPEKAMKFLELKESESWIRELHLAFKLFFEKALPIKELMDQLNAQQVAQTDV
ncbi:hypothetical protein [Vibrio algarum]|uniref:Uncharacterized protein n=1 Tax=Vibrio algarum TaxID=3020714 RepID=A0ABT4YT75_9VIBR|nr:hypothetical protein [Vibrio sp. KJ40-1]MDB1124258.1 hypothetical protein [Vibrio sp. KJ40-1]